MRRHWRNSVELLAKLPNYSARREPADPPNTMVIRSNASLNRRVPELPIFYSHPAEP